jgi:polyisoprenoid-binding protein YceI
MKKLTLVIAIIILFAFRISAQEIFATEEGQVSFFSKAPVADVDATNKKVSVELNTSSNELTFTMTMTDFEFANSKMGRDARDKYLETEQFKAASFHGKINGNINYHKPGSYPATARGKLKIHGVERDVVEKGTVIVVKDIVTLKSQFQVALKDYNIETPKILGQEMTSENVLININVALTERTKDLAKKK